MPTSLEVNIVVQYKKGTKMFVSDALSRAYVDDISEANIVNEFTVHSATTVFATPAQKQAIIEATSADLDLHQLLQCTETSWPSNISVLSPI